MSCPFVTGGQHALTQWRSHWGCKGGRVPPLTVQKMLQIGKKEGKNREKRGEIRKKRQKLGKFFHFTPPDR